MLVSCYVSCAYHARIMLCIITYHARIMLCIMLVSCYVSCAYHARIMLCIMCISLHINFCVSHRVSHCVSRAGPDTHPDCDTRRAGRVVIRVVIRDTGAPICIRAYHSVSRHRYHKVHISEYQQISDGVSLQDGTVLIRT